MFVFPNCLRHISVHYNGTHKGFLDTLEPMQENATPNHPLSFLSSKSVKSPVPHDLMERIIIIPSSRLDGLTSISSTLPPFGEYSQTHRPFNLMTLFKWFLFQAQWILLSPLCNKCVGCRSLLERTETFLKENGVGVRVGLWPVRRITSVYRRTIRGGWGRERCSYCVSLEFGNFWFMCQEQIMGTLKME